MHTESDARKLWCPFARVSAANAFNRHAGGGLPPLVMPKEALCIASECMAWRWMRYIDGTITAWDLTHKSKIDGVKHYRAATGATLKDAVVWANKVLDGSIDRPSEEAKGFCGLAGEQK